MNCSVKFRKIAVGLLAALFLAAALLGAALLRSASAAASEIVLSDGGVETTVLDVNPVANDPSMPEGGIANMPAGCIAGGANGFDSRGYMVTADNPPPAIPAGSSDDKVMYFEMLDSHQGLARLEFTQTVRAEKVGGIRIKMYISLDDDVSSAALIKGKHYLMADRYDMQNRYWYELGLRCNQQMQWITIEIGGSDVMRLADEDGNIGALYLYYDTYSHAEKPSKNGHIFIDEISYTLATEEDNEGGDPFLTTFSPRTAALDTDPRMNNDEIPDDTGLANMPAGCVGGGGGFGTRATDMAAMPAGSSDGYGYSFEIVNSHQSLAHIAFMRYKGGEVAPYSVAVSDIAGITVKMYVDVETDAAAGTAVNGKYYLMADRYDMENYYWYEFDFTRDMQRQWIYVHIKGEDLSKLADEDGNIGGLYFYYDTYSHAEKPSGGTIYFDEIRFDEYTVTFSGADVPEQTLLYNEVLQLPEDPVSEGKVFAGWCTQQTGSAATLFDFSRKITQDLTLYAWWTDAAQTKLEPGLYRAAGGGEISVYEDGTLYEKGVAPYGTAVSFGTENGTNYLFFRVGGKFYAYVYEGQAITAGGEEYLSTEYCTVTFSHYGDIADRYFVHTGGSAEEIAAVARPGYVFRYWSADGSAPFDFEKAIESDITLSALWDYDAVDDVSSLAGTYYDETSGDKIVLLADGTGSMVTANGSAELRFYLLTSGNIVVESGGAVYESAYDALLKTFAIGGKNFVGLRWYSVSFYSDGALISQVILKDGLYTVSAPETPVKENYTFKGWALSDGSLFDFSQTVTESLALYAVWAYSGPAPQGGNGWVWGVVAAAAVVAVAAVAAAAVYLIKSKNKTK